MKILNFFKKFSYSLVFCALIINTAFSNEINNQNLKIDKCVACHTMSGNSIVPLWPKLADQHKDYMIKQLFEFKKGKDGSRFDPTMLGILQGMTNDELNEIAEYFSKQTIQKSKTKDDPMKLDIGKRIYLYGKTDEKIVGCSGCHGIDGTGNKLANFPSLRWQHKEYLVTQLKKFKTGERSNDINGIMKDISTNMTNEYIDAVASYISVMD